MYKSVGEIRYQYAPDMPYRVIKRTKKWFEDERKRLAAISDSQSDSQKARNQLEIMQEKLRFMEALKPIIKKLYCEIYETTDAGLRLVSRETVKSLFDEMVEVCLKKDITRLSEEGYYPGKGIVVPVEYTRAKYRGWQSRL